MDSQDINQFVTIIAASAATVVFTWLLILHSEKIPKAFAFTAIAITNAVAWIFRSKN